ncbi:hypothetical protein RsS62_63210 [Rhizobium dioscoreae]|nr:hypothetical protein RsS62_63210 [Rhizobium dioscoreae]GES52957.1 hypothetical protein RsS93_55710 [Rhizobium dioscoreae]GLU84485.1 hypothetical protein Rhsp01_56610 [Rhizobium sp. NBRC 114257]
MAGRRDVSWAAATERFAAEEAMPMWKRFELWLVDQIDRIFGLERLARRAGFSPDEARRIAREK